MKDITKLQIIKKNKGITLIALVITIIVLLILAGVTIATLTGENGVLTKAQTAKNKTDISTAKEKVQIAVMGSYGTDGKLDVNELKENLKQIEGITGADSITSLPTTITADGYQVTISEKGEVTVGEIEENPSNPPTPPEEKVIVSAEQIANSEDKTEYYGATVEGYIAQTVNGKDYNQGVTDWKIFYADNNNIYLIAGDYIHYDYCPQSKTKTIYKHSDYNLSFDDVISDYSGSSNVTDVKIKALNNEYFNTKKYTSTNTNMKAVAYMLDTNVWEGYKGEKSEYAIGGPTVELFFKSYNEKYNTNYQIRANSKTGYEFSFDGGNTWDEYHPTERKFNKDDSLYFITKQGSGYTTTDAMWLASPSAFSVNDIMYVYPFVSINYNNYGYYTRDSVGFRPLVCLSNDVQLEKKESGIYVIK